MKIQINQQEIEEGIKLFIKKTSGIDINTSEIKLTATRGDNGVIADIEINGMCGNSNSDKGDNVTKRTQVQEPQKERSSKPTQTAATPVSKESKDEPESEPEQSTEPESTGTGKGLFGSSSSDKSDNSSDTESKSSHTGQGLFGDLSRVGAPNE